jgi:hypothetical protein
LFRRFKASVGEIDIVARRRGVLVFVEVKARENLDDAAEAIGKRQQSRIIAAAAFWRAGDRCVALSPRPLSHSLLDRYHDPGRPDVPFGAFRQVVAQ